MVCIMGADSHMVSMVSMVSKYGIMDHFTLNLRPKEYFQLAPNMRTAYIELCIYVMSKSVTYRLGGHIPIW